MKHSGHSFDANLVAAAGDDAQLHQQLRADFTQAIERQIDLLIRARCDGNWHIAARRLHGLAASFHSGELLVLAEELLEAAPGEPRIIRKLKKAVDTIGT